jgi:V/A-type H+/Na+-transporting ATPase subunit C
MAAPKNRTECFQKTLHLISLVLRSLSLIMPIYFSPLIAQHFAFAHGRIGTLQQVLLTQSDVDRLLGAQGSTGVEQVFIELKMTNPIDQSIQDGDTILRTVAQWMRNEVENMTPINKRPVFNILWMEGDAPILSYLLKKYHGLTSEISQNPVSGIFAYSPEKLHALVENGTEGDLPKHLIEFVREVKQRKNSNPKTIDTDVAQYVATTRLRLARSSGSKDIVRFVQHHIDSSNIRTALRLAEYNASECLPYLLHGGTIRVEDLAQSKQSILKAVQRSGISFRLTDLLSSEYRDVNAVEQELTKVIASDIAKMWNVPLSIEPLFAFASIAILQLKLMRMILIGKRNDLSPQEIKAALPPFISSSHYVL